MARGEIVIADYDDRWPALYDEERLRLVPALGDSPVATEHIGSTAVAGLAAKPIIDIMASVHGPPQSDECMAALQEFGYGHWRDNGPWWKFCRRGMRRSHHLHLIDISGDEGQDHWRRELLFPDYLRAHPHQWQRYEALKRGLAERFATDWEAYELHKTEFMEGCLERVKQLRELG